MIRILEVSSTLPGYSVCRESWLRLLGVGKNRLRRTKRRHRGQDERQWKCGHLSLSPNQFSRSISIFFDLCYLSIGPLPIKYLL